MPTTAERFTYHDPITLQMPARWVCGYFGETDDDDDDGSISEEFFYDKEDMDACESFVENHLGEMCMFRILDEREDVPPDEMIAIEVVNITRNY